MECPLITSDCSECYGLNPRKPEELKQITKYRNLVKDFLTNALNYGSMEREQFTISNRECSDCFFERDLESELKSATKFEDLGIDMSKTYTRPTNK